MKYRIITMGILFAVIVVGGVAGGWLQGDNDPPKALEAKMLFSHQKHIDGGIDCATCHSTISESMNASDRNQPGHDVCQTCHEEKVNESCDFCHIGDPGPLPTVDTQLRFNHKFHISDQKSECSTCHKGIEKSIDLSSKHLPSMEACNSCHDRRVAGNECEKCHTDVATLWPASHSKGNFKKNHAQSIRLGRYDSQCRACHSENSCSQCHDGSNLTSLTAKEQTGLVSPRTVGNDKSQALAGQGVHDVNYRFTHGIDAKGRAMECQTCHHEQTFCAECHAQGSQALGGAVPTSHEVASFTTIGIRSGGGRHAQLAKRDIESCTVCHDAEGSDPTCTRCHVDADGIKNTDPKTHASGFMRDMEGDWHTDAGAVCYSCHTDPSAKPRPHGTPGKGFCSYCHGAK